MTAKRLYRLVAFTAAGQSYGLDRVGTEASVTRAAKRELAALRGLSRIEVQDFDGHSNCYRIVATVAA